MVGWFTCYVLGVDDLVCLGGFMFLIDGFLLDVLVFIVVGLVRSLVLLLTFLF